ncbi:MAG: tetratricopeptide repeat protein [Patescibacteria group bacterium]
MAKYTKQKCVHCLLYQEKLTKDHIFPKSWYSDSTPSNVEKWTVPSCEPCNNKLSSAEEELFNRLAICVDENDLAASGVSKKFISRISLTSKNQRQLGRQIKLLMDTAKAFIPYLYEEGNQYVLKGGTPKDGVRTRRMIRIPGDKLQIVSEKIIRGLEFRLRDRLIEDDRKIEIIVPHEHRKKELELINNWNKLILPIEENAHRGYGFIVRYGVNPSDSDWIVYNIKIWGHLEIWAMIHPKDNKVKKLQENLGQSNKYLNKALKLYQKKRFNEALKFVNFSIVCNQNNFTAYNTKSYILNELKRYSEALDVINNGIKLNPNNFLMISNKVSTLGLLEKYDEALTITEQALLLKPDDNYIWHKKGVSLYHLGRYAESIDAFNTSLRIKPDFTLSIEKKISALVLSGRLKEAVELFKSSSLPKEDYNLLLNNIGYAFLQLGEYGEASRYLDEAKLIYKNQKEIYYNLYKLNFRLNNFGKSLLYFLKFKFLSYRNSFTKIIKMIFKNIRQRNKS